jgi:DNA-binding NarL/FixJ family response regulator
MNWAYLFSAISLLGCAFTFVFFLHRTKQSRILDSLQNDINEMMQQINEITDRDITLVEDRVNALKTLLNDADKQITALREKAYRAIGVASSLATSLRPLEEIPRPEPEPKEVSHTLSTREQVAQLYADGFDPARIAAKLGLSVAEVETIVAFL